MSFRNMLLLLAFVASAFGTASAAPPFPDRGRAGLVDAAHVLAPAAARVLNERVVAWDRRTGHQLVVATVPDLQGLDVKTYGYQLGRAWGLGDKQRNDGAILLLSLKPREVRIEVGYGLEPVLTDAATSAILADRVVPKLKAGDIAGALGDGADAIMAVAATEEAKPAPPSGNSAATSTWLLLAGVAAGAVAAWAWVRRQRLRRQRMHDMAASGQARSRFAPIKLADGPVDRVDAVYIGDRPVKRQRPPCAPMPAAPAYVPPVIAPSSYDQSPRRSDDNSSSSLSSSDFGSSGSSDSGSSSSSDSSSGFDSGGGSFGGGGSDSSW